MSKKMTQLIPIIAVSSLLSSYLLYAAGDEKEEKNAPSSSSSSSSGHSHGQPEAGNPHSHEESSCDPKEVTKIQEIPAELTAIMTSYLPVEEWEDLDQTELAKGKSLAVSRLEHLTLPPGQSVIKILTSLLKNSDGSIKKEHKNLKSLDASRIQLNSSDMEFITSRFPQLEVLNLNGSFEHLDEHEKIESLSYLKRLEHLQTLSVSKNKLKNTALTMLLTSLIMRSANAKPSGLTALDLEGCELGDQGLSILARNLRHLPLLTDLNIGSTSCGAPGLEALAKGFVHSSKLKKFNVANNNFSAAGTQHLATILARSPELTDLNVAGNYLEAAGLEALANGLVHSSKLKKLDVANNHLQTAGAQHLATILARSPELTDLNIENNNIKAAGFKALANGLVHSSKLKKLNIADNYVGNGTLYDGNNYPEAITAEDWTTLHTRAPELTDLNLEHNYFADAGFEAFARGFVRSSKLKKLSVALNYFNQAGAQHLTTLLAHTPLLTDFNVGHNRLGAEGAKALANGLGHTPLLRDLNIADTSLGTAGFKALAKGLAHTSQLRVLNIANNELAGRLTMQPGGDVTAEDWTNTLARTPLLTYLDVGGNNLKVACGLG